MPSASLDLTLTDAPGHYLVTRSGMRLRLRPVTPSDGPLLADFLSRLSAEDMRFRFLDTRKPTAADIAAMLEVNHRRNEHVLAFDASTGELVASLMLVADDKMETAEVSIAVASGQKEHGIGWSLLRHASDLTFIRGLKKLQCIESRAHHEALEVERALGFHARDVPGDPSLMLLEADLG